VRTTLFPTLARRWRKVLKVGPPSILMLSGTHPVWAGLHSLVGAYALFILGESGVLLPLSFLYLLLFLVAIGVVSLATRAFHCQTSASSWRATVMASFSALAWAIVGPVLILRLAFADVPFADVIGYCPTATLEISYHGPNPEAQYTQDVNKGLDERVDLFLTRSLKEAEYPYVWLDATFPKVREDNRVQSTALVVAMGVRRDGFREVLGINLGAAETEAFWKEFLRDLVARGLRGVRLVIGDAHQGVINAIQQVLGEVAWQRCQVHFMRNILSHAPKSAQPEVGNLVRTIFQQPTHQLAEAQLKRIVLELEKRFPKGGRYP
jgi:uncharacterized protein with HEPN domain